MPHCIKNNYHATLPGKNQARHFREFGADMSIGWKTHFQKTMDFLFQPDIVIPKLASSGDLKPAGISLALTSVLFAVSSLTAEWVGVPMTDAPPLPLAHYRLWQAAAMPLILAAGCVLGAGTGAAVSCLFSRPCEFRRLLAVVPPALLAPLWPMLWPTDMAVSLGLLNAGMPGFPGLWVRDLAPALTFLYMLVMLWQAFWLTRKLLLREAFASAVFSLVPALGWWAVILR